ncbi:MAG: hypothetical protein JJ863_38790 [Deltaproteobacteria bacterium]|nr:hypothetical protein [Deltaproteobacteria bacterium]
MSRTRGRVIAAVALWMVASVAGAQDVGLELSVDGSRQALRGQSWTLRGHAFEVRGLATLDPAAGATVRGRLHYDDHAIGDAVETRSDPDGSYVLSVPIPVDAPATATVHLTVASNGVERTVQESIQITHAETLELRTDRRFYHRGERAHAWALVRDLRTLAPVAGRAVRFDFAGPEGQVEQVVRTDASGVAHHVFRLPNAAGNASVGAVVAEPVSGASGRTTIEIGRRTMERMLVELDWPESHVVPSGTFHPQVRVVAPSGEPARGATFTLTVEGMEPITGRTDDGGLWSGEATAPAYLANDTGVVSVTLVVSHPAIGSARASKALRLQGSGGYAIRAFTEGALAFDLDTTVYFALEDSAGERAPAGIDFTVRTPMVRGGQVRLTTDAHGLASTTFRAVPMRAVPGLCENVGTLFEVEDDQGKKRELCLPAAQADVALRATTPVREPGEALVIELSRHRRVARRPVAVSLMSRATGELLAATVAGPNDRRVTFDTPAVLGTLLVSARPIRDEDTGRSGEGIESHVAVLVRPPSPAFVEAEPTQPTYEVGSTAGVRIRTGGEPGWVAVDVRDLAQHGGEVPFSLRMLRGAFSRAMLDPSTEDADRLLRAALAARITAPQMPREATEPTHGPGPNRPATVGGGTIRRDPVLVARLITREKVGDAMRTVERLFRERGADALATGDGARRRFDPQVVNTILEDADLRTLGDRPLTLAHLKEADAGFGFQAAARRVAREQLIRVLQQLVQGIESGQIDGERPERWVSEMVRHLDLDPAAVRDPWGGPLGARRRPADVVAPSPDAPEWTLAFPGPDGRLGNGDDVVDPFARVVARGTLYADVSGEEDLLAALSMIVPVSQTLNGWVEALARVTAAMEATLRGDAASAEEIGESFGFGGLGLRGTGRGGGGSGYGSGYGRRGARAPQIRGGRASVIDSLDQLAGRVRVDFPGTLLFVPSQPTGDDGVTEIAIPLADAATTYLVEVVHWRGDGWSHSTDTRFSTQKPLIVEAPLPAMAHVGEVVQVPVRVRSREAMDVEVGLVAEGELELQVGDAQRIHVDAGGAAVAYVSVEVRSAGTGSLVAVARGGGHDDAIRMPIQTFRDVRRVSRTDDQLLSGETTLVFGATDREPGAWALQPSQVRLTSATRLFATDADGDWLAYARALEGEASDPSGRSGTRAALAGWSHPRLTDERARATLLQLSEQLGEGGTPLERAYELVHLAAAWQLRDGRPELREDLERLRENLIATVEADATEASSDSAAIHALAAFGLALHGERAMAGELARRARRDLVRFGDQVWLPAENRTLGSRGASAALALADLELGAPEEAFAILRTIADQRRAEPLQHPWRPYYGEGLAQLLAARLGRGELTEVEATLAGQSATVRVQGGEARFTAKLRRGRGAVPVRLPDNQIVVARVISELGIPWPEEAVEDGPLRATVAMDSPTLDGSVTATLTVRNAVPRSIREPMLTVTLPAGAVLDERARSALNERLAEPVVVEAERLRMTPRALLPGTEIELPITLRYELGGELSGFGVDAWSNDRPDRRTVVPPQTIRIEVSR